jgi:RNA polymerase sigma-70 factor (ECF subfamily)
VRPAGLAFRRALDVLLAAMPPTPTTDSRFTEIEGHRAYLVRYALSQLRDPQLAEEAVQEALLAALEGIGGFDGRSTLRTWLTSILRFKIIDIQRRQVADRARVQIDEERLADEHEAWLDEMFDETGHWRSPPQAWNDPEAALEQSRFWMVFEMCLEGLPATAGRVFFKREVLGEDTPVICSEEKITSSNCWVILHRARIALRMCLERNWFGSEAPSER